MTPVRTVKQIAELVGGALRGESDVAISGVATIRDAVAGEITWASHIKFADRIAQSAASAVLVAPDFPEVAIPAIECADVEWALLQLLAEFAPPLPHPPAGVDSSARVHPTATLGPGVAIGPNVVIEAGASIGENARLHAGVFVGARSSVGRASILWNNVVVREGCRLGDRVIVHPGAVIGADGFGYIYRQGAQHKYPHLGTVVVEDDVEIGACACVDRGKTGVTHVQRGAKIDNLAQVAHNVVIGADSILCAQVGVAGSTQLGRLVVLGGQAGIRDNITLGDNVMVAACSCVPQDVPSGARIAGVPAVDARQSFRQNTSLAKLPELIAQMRNLARRIENLEAAADHQPDRGT